ncbi:hypothetical protein [Natrinema caseinilyticum]|uniref:hypothetical protein n=1 Tax=Natrinema caseinilyticum TaxID=2961570 RepID=UPI0020C46B69|nr:hypothetical protein [Natrinema caseinilyticum]
MSVRLPSVRHPHSFYDVFSVVTVAVAIMALVLTIWYGSIIRAEMVVFIAIIFMWAVWAIERILSESEERAKRQERQLPWDK